MMRVALLVNSLSSPADSSYSADLLQKTCTQAIGRRDAVNMGLV
jgi:hypothetical protein